MTPPPLSSTPDIDLAQRYAAGTTTVTETIQVEQAMDISSQWRATVGSAVPAARLDLNFDAISVELDAPKRGRIERLMGFFGLPEHVTRLMAATPVLRRSWYVAATLVLFFGILAADPTRDNSSVLVFLAMAPLVPVLGVGLAYGPGIDPAHDMTVATPLSGFRLLLLRAIAVMATSVVFGGVASLIWSSEYGLRIIAWLLPALALTTITLALTAFMPTRAAAGVTAAGWLLVVIVVARTATDFTMFGGPAQLVYLLLASTGGAVMVAKRHAFDVAEVAS